MSLMGIDIGTSCCKASVFRADGEMIHCARRRYELQRDNSGGVVLPSEEVWRKIREVIAEAASKVAGSDPVEALCAASMGEAVVPFDDAGHILGDSVTGLDSRGEEFLARLTAAVPATEFYRITGLFPGAEFTLPHLMWLHEEQPELWRKCACFLPWADLVGFQLCGRAVCNRSLAGRTLLYDSAAGEWSESIAAAAGIDPGKLPPPERSGVPLGRIRPALVRELNLSPETVVVAGTHDQCAAALGSGACRENGAMLGLGTFACLVLVHNDPGEGSPFRALKLNIEEGVEAGQFVSFLYHASGGALIEWMRREFYRDLPEEGVFDAMFREIDPVSSGTPCVLPFFAGTGPLDYLEGGQGLFSDLNFSHSRASLLQGALEGITLYFREALELLAKRRRRVEEIRVTGGGSDSELWLQMAADLLEVPVRRSVSPECGTLGCAMLAGVGCGRFADLDEAAEQMVRSGRLFLPDPAQTGRSAALFRRYCDRKAGCFSRC